MTATSRLDHDILARIVPPRVDIASMTRAWGRQRGRVVDHLPGDRQGILDRYRDRRAELRSHSRHGRALGLSALRRRACVVEVGCEIERGWIDRVNTVMPGECRASTSYFPCWCKDV